MRILVDMIFALGTRSDLGGILCGEEAMMGDLPEEMPFLCLEIALFGKK